MRLKSKSPKCRAVWKGNGIAPAMPRASSTPGSRFSGRGGVLAQPEKLRAETRLLRPGLRARRDFPEERQVERPVRLVRVDQREGAARLPMPCPAHRREPGAEEGIALVARFAGGLLHALPRPRTHARTVAQRLGGRRDGQAEPAREAADGRRGGHRIQRLEFEPLAVHHRFFHVPSRVHPLRPHRFPPEIPAPNKNNCTIPPRRRPRRLARRLGRAVRQTAPAAASASPGSEEVIALGEFMVAAEKSQGYRATNAITATGIGTRIADTSLPICVIGAELIADTGSFDVRHVLNLVPGVLTNPRNKSGVVIRGFAGRIADRNGRYRRQLMTTRNMERTEVIKRPAGIFFGAVRPGGIVNTVTAKPVFSGDFTDVKVMAGNEEFVRGACFTNHVVNKNLAIRAGAQPSTCPNGCSGPTASPSAIRAGAPGEFELEITGDGTAGIGPVVELRIRPGGTLAGAALRVGEPDTFLLPAGTLRYTVGGDTIEIGPRAAIPGGRVGNLAGEAYSWRGGQLRPEGLRVSLGGVTPFRHTLTVR